MELIPNQTPSSTYKNRRRVAFLVGLAILALTCAGWIWWTRQLHLDPKTVIISPARFIITPTTWKANKEIRFTITIECFQKPELTALDLSKTTLLSDTHEFLEKPLSWTPKRESPHKVTGELIFPAPSKKPQKWTLSIFTEEETIVSW
jgi:hypothetical protein